MRYWVCALLGIALFGACVVAFSGALGDLLETGTCASGNTPYVISRPCPEGTGTSILLLIGSIFGLFAAMGIFALRGTRPGGGKGLGGSAYVAGWGIFFTATGAVSLIKSLTSDTIPVDGKTGGIIVGVTFLLMGLPALVYWVWSVFMDIGGRDERPAGMGAATGAGSIGSRGFGPGTFATFATSPVSSPTSAPASGRAWAQRRQATPSRSSSGSRSCATPGP